MPALQKTGLVMLGYLVAVFVAVFVSLAVRLLPTVLPDNGAWGSFYGSVRNLSSVFQFGLAITFPTALPGFLVTLMLAARAGWQHWYFFAIAGSLNVLPSFAVLSLYLRAPTMPLDFVLACLPGGFAGGFIYWGLAGYFIAKERRTATP